MPKRLSLIPPVIAQEYEQVASDTLILHPRNIRQSDLGEIIESIKANGFYGALIAQRSTRHVLAGNHRLEAARSVGIPSVPVIWVDVTDDAALRVMLVDNATQDKASNNDAALAELLAGLANTESGLTGTGYSLEELQSLIDGMAGPMFEPDPEPTSDGAGPENVTCPHCGKSFNPHR